MMRIFNSLAFLHILIFIGITLDKLIAQDQIAFTLAEQIASSTVRLEVYDKANKLKMGTGFFFLFYGKNGEEIPVIATNRHVLKDAKIITFYLTVYDGKNRKNLIIPIKLEDIDSLLLMHPDNSIDLAVIFIGPKLNEISNMGYRPFFKILVQSLIPSNEKLKQLDAIEEILMVGYPTGILDSVNNYPIFRRGITATHPGNKYQGRDEFLIDVACYPGNSGSPIFIYNSGAYYDKRDSSIVAGNRILFIGILRGGIVYNEKGEIKIVTIPDDKKSLTNKSLINLGIALRASKLLDFENIIRNMFK